ncbi:helix-turn-helix transcriptional regulator [Kutzneria sp. CA-103260]|uniref:helix-turn-helix transcriptional regulator n=1 Tax=Kutzneria sp. CA-103260 TaxID=2802641 RepID=UPI001BA48422|nr:LuxR family transcriptional regulator [Kutzneria sp. CA-103260]QUQ67832.1 HTH-type transcriptional regulator MalT [Kutzneria sp. CA-103260]
MQPQVLERSLPNDRRPLRGRDRQLDRIAAGLSARERRTLLLAAPVGSGKTRLLQEAATMAAERGFTVVDGPDVTALSLPVALAPHSNPSSWLTAPLERHLVAQLRRGPVLVAVDNLHWLDPLTATALRDLMVRMADRPLMWIFAMRAEHLDSPNGLLLGEMAADPCTEWLAPLDPLPDNVVTEVVADLLDATPDAGLLSLCECMGGSPRAITELVRGLVEDGAVLVTAGIAHLRLALLPQRFLTAVRVRLGQLDPATQQVVQVAAVLGRRFGPADLAAMLAVPPATLLKPLQEAMNAGLVESLADAFEFRREPVWRAVLDTVPRPMLSLLGHTVATGWDGVSLTARADSMWSSGRVEDALATVRKAAAQESPWHFDPRWTLAWMQIRLRRLPDAAETLQSIEDSLAATKVLASIPSALRSWLAFAAGAIAEAEAEALAGIGLVAGTQMPLYEPHLRAVLVLCALRRGDVAAAAERLQFFDTLPASAMRTWVTAQVAAACRGPEAALAVLSEVRTDAARRRELLLEDPSAAAWCVRTALAAGDEIFARLVVAAAADLGLSPHARALYQRDPSALAAVEYSDPWAQASATEDLGSVLCTQDRDAAVVAFDQAMECYDSLGSAWDSARVRSRLRRLGIRRRHWHRAPRPSTGWASLTGTEEKVARLVAHGLTNRQVAAELFVSPHTVGFHLRQIYRKLAIQSRVDLARIAP